MQKHDCGTLYTLFPRLRTPLRCSSKWTRDLVAHDATLSSQGLLPRGVIPQYHPPERCSGPDRLENKAHHPLPLSAFHHPGQVGKQARTNTDMRGSTNRYNSAAALNQTGGRHQSPVDFQLSRLRPLGASQGIGLSTPLARLAPLLSINHHREKSTRSHDCPAHGGLLSHPPSTAGQPHWTVQWPARSLRAARADQFRRACPIASLAASPMNAPNRSLDSSIVDPAGFFWGAAKRVQSSGKQPASIFLALLRS